MANILQLARRHRAQIDKADAANLKQVTSAYLRMYDNLQGDVDALRLAIEAIESPSVAQIKALPQYKRLLKHGADELDRFNVYLQTQISVAGNDAVQLGLFHSKELVNAMVGGQFGGLKANVVAPLLDYLRRDGPLFARLAQITYATSAGVSDAIIKGISLGWNPRKTAAAIQDAFGGGLTDALQNMRTLQLWSYRDSARANYMATNGIVTGWQWFAELDESTCEACAAEHGTIHPLDEPLGGHRNCRCAALPYIEGISEDVGSGEQWFNSLSEAEQKQFMGAGKLEAYQAGKFDFSQLSKEGTDIVYGNVRVPSSLADLIGEE